MRIAIITFHNTMNFGASLQSAALYRYLTSDGNIVKVINYLPKYIMNKKSPLKELKNASGFRGMVKGLAYLLFCPLVLKKDKRYDGFIKENTCLSKIYHSFYELEQSYPQADVFICGSDQIWNPNLTGKKLDPSFFLEFVHDNNIVKASYGSSFGEFDIEGNKNVLLQLTSDFKYISVREASAASRLSECINKQVSVVLDPTLMLTKSDYSVMEKPINCKCKKYVLLYNIQNSSKSTEVAREIAKKYNWGLVDISANPFKKAKGSKRIMDLGPGEFLTLFKNAEYVVTNSFHGTAFSIIYEKQFSSVLHTTRGGRIADLLDSLNLKNRIVSGSGKLNTEKIEYDAVNKLLTKYRNASKEYLDSILSISIDQK